MANQIKKKFLAPEFVTQVDVIEQDLAQEQIARELAQLELEGKIEVEKGRIDAILDLSQADKDSFKEIVDLINSVDTENDEAFAGYVTSNNAALANEVNSRTEADLQMLKLDGSRSMTGNLNFGGGALSPVVKTFGNFPVNEGVSSLGVNFSISLDQGFNPATESVSLQKVFGGVTTTVATWSGGAWSYIDETSISNLGTPSVTGAIAFTPLWTGTLTHVFTEMVAAGYKITNLTSGTSTKDAVNKGQLDSLQSEVNITQTGAGLNSIGQYVPNPGAAKISNATSLFGADVLLNNAIVSEENARISADSALSLRLDSLETDPVTKAYVDAADLVLDGKIESEKSRIDAILLASDADKDSFAEIVSLINSVDTENDQAFAGYVLSNNAALAQEVSDREVGDSETLTSANEYTDNQIAAIPAVDLSGYYTKTEVNGKETGLQNQIDAEKVRLDAVLYASNADKDSFAEIVTLINSVDTENDSVFSGYALSNNARVSALEAKGFSKGSHVTGIELGFIDLDREYLKILSVSVGRLAVHEGDDYTLSVVGGVTRLTWVNSLANPSGEEKIETGDKVFWSGAF